MKKILVIGPQYKNHKGGVGVVIDMHIYMFPDFSYYSTYIPFKNSLVRFFIVFFRILYFPIFLHGKNYSKFHIHGASKGSFMRKFFYYKIIRNLSKSKIIYHIHGGAFHHFISDSGKIINRWIKDFIQNVECVVVLSDSWLEFFKNRFPEGTFCRIYNPIKCNNIENINRSSNCINFLFLGQISNNKGCFEIISATKILSSRGYSFKVNLEGNGEIKKLESLIN